MPWQSLGQFQLIDEWIFSSPVAGEIFRISHQSIGNANDKYLKAVVAQGFDDGKVNIFNPQRLSYRPESEIFTFYFPAGIAQQKLLFKRLDQTDIDWIIEAEVFLAGDSQEDFANYIIARFGELMPLFPGSNKVETKRYQYTANTEDKAVGAIGSKIIAENEYRRAASIFNSSSLPVTIGLRNNEQGVVTAILAVIPPKGIYELPLANDGIYTGDIYACAGSDASVEATEFWVDP